MNQLKFIFLLIFTTLIISPPIIAQTSDTTVSSFEGKIISKRGNNIVMSIQNKTNLPAIKQNGKLSLYFEEKIFGINTTGWLDIGETEIIKISDQQCNLLLKKELSEITKNGKKVDHFKPNNIVRFSWQ